jgi:8-oxo-dGTP diphosphatase
VNPLDDAPRIRIVAAVIRDATGRVLLVRKRGAEVFQQPGGKRDPGDVDDLATLARELDEELGCRLRTDSVRFLCQAEAPAANERGHVVEGRIYVVDVDGEPQPRAEIEELRWVDPAVPDVPVAQLSFHHILPLLTAKTMV